MVLWFLPVSQAVLQHRNAAKILGTKRDRLIDKGLLELKEDSLVFTKDIEFGSPSTAGGVVVEAAQMD